MVIKHSDYTADAVSAARSVLLELVRLLGEYRDDIVVIGGWIPTLLLPHSSEQHIGSIDIDLALNHSKLQEAGYRTIQQLLESRGYRQDERQPFIYWRPVVVNRREIMVEVDLLAGEYEGTGKNRRTQSVQGVRPRKARGCDLAFEMSAHVKLEGTLPEGGIDSATVRVATIVPFLVMKGMALHDRLKEKDAYDIYFCLKHCVGGLDSLIEDFRPHLNHGLVREGLEKIADKFSSPQHIGPKSVADFLDVADPEERDLLMRDAYERANHLLRELGIRMST